MDSSALISHRRPSISTYTAKEFFPLDPDATSVDPVDIAHALAMKCRYTGHCIRFYSVAEHSVHMADWALAEVGPRQAVLALLHDGAEAYLPDVASPIKSYIPGFREMEDRVFAAIVVRFGLSVTPEYTDYVKALDVDMFRVERPCVMVPAPWWSEHDAPEDMRAGIEIQFWDPERAELEWLRRFVALGLA